VTVAVETCWACGRTEQYDTAKHHKPFHWKTSLLAEKPRMLCPGCRKLLNVQGRISHILIQSVLVTRGIAIDDHGHVVS
jgi:hypothetical protein